MITFFFPPFTSISFLFCVSVPFCTAVLHESVLNLGKQIKFFWLILVLEWKQSGRAKRSLRCQSLPLLHLLWLLDCVRLTACSARRTFESGHVARRETGRTSSPALSKCVCLCLSVLTLNISATSSDMVSSIIFHCKTNIMLYKFHDKEIEKG